MQICAMAGVDFKIATPRGYELPIEELAIAQDFAKIRGSTILQTYEPVEAVQGVNAVYADIFVSMGQELEKKTRAEAFKNYRVDTNLMKHAIKDVIFMHCLPAYRGAEVTSDVIDSKWSRVFDQAECRLHIAKALIAKLLAKLCARCFSVFSKSF